MIVMRAHQMITKTFKRIDKRINSEKFKQVKLTRELDAGNFRRDRHQIPALRVVLRDVFLSRTFFYFLFDSFTHRPRKISNQIEILTRMRDHVTRTQTTREPGISNKRQVYIRKGMDERKYNLLRRKIQNVTIYHSTSQLFNALIQANAEINTTPAIVNSSDQRHANGRSLGALSKIHCFVRTTLVRLAAEFAN